MTKPKPIKIGPFTIPPGSYLLGLLKIKPPRKPNR